MMKKKTVLFANLVIALVLLLGNKATLQAQNNKVEIKIQEAFAAAWKSDASPIESVINQLEGDKNITGSKHYWKAYATYQLAIYYLATKKTDQAEEATEIAIETLEDIKTKSSEEYALLSCLTGFSIQFSPMSAAFLGPKAAKYAQKSIQLNPSNLRAHYARALNDFYTPKIFGGGDVVESHLKKAINLQHKTEEGSNHPSWGKDEAFELLVRFYIREDRIDDAKLYCNMGVAQYPQHPRLTKHAKTLGLQ